MTAWNEDNYSLQPGSSLCDYPKNEDALGIDALNDVTGRKHIMTAWNEDNYSLQPGSSLWDYPKNEDALGIDALNDVTSRKHIMTVYDNNNTSAAGLIASHIYEDMDAVTEEPVSSEY